MARYTSSGATGTVFASTVDVTITTETSAQSVWSETNLTASKTVYPLTEGDLVDGTASTITEVPIQAAVERVKVVVAQGGDTKSGTFDFVIG